MEPRFSLRWNNYTTELADAFGSLLLEEDLVDVTLCCEGRKIKAHKMLLSACSPYFHEIFKENPCQHPVIVFKNVLYADLKAIVEFVYCGEVSVAQDQLESFLNTAGELEVKGLVDKENEIGADESTMADEDKTHKAVTEEQTDSTKSLKKKSISKSPATSRRSSPVPKKRKPNDEKLREASAPPLQMTTLNIKEEVQEVEEVADENYVDADVSNTFSKEASPLRNDAEASNCSAKDAEEPSTEENIKEKIESIQVDSAGHTEMDTQETTTPDVEIVELESSVSIKEKDISIKENPLKDEIPTKPIKKTTGAKSPSVVKAPPKKVNDKIQIPKGLVVTPVKPASKVVELFDFPAVELQVQDEACSLRSEEATTPVHSEPIPYSQDTMFEAQPEQSSEGGPEVAEEAPTLQEQIESEEEPEKEQTKFDYFGCEVCINEAKPVDLERITFPHKCPICPCCCFCAHLLKEHMKVIHGWFNVQRRFTQY